jgi:ferric-dicitrate binding protein FerR (iron transport regulator)
VLCWYVTLLHGCGSCSDGPPAIATLIEAQGEKVERDFAAQVQAWQVAQVGASFGLGDGVRTGTNTSARLTLMDQTQLQLAQNTTLRFMVDDAQQGEQAFNVEAGEVAMRVGQKDLMLRTQIGLAKLLAGTEITLRKSGEQLDYDVALGEAQFKTSTGEYRSIKAGESLEVGIGMAVFSKAPPVAEPSQPEAVDPSGIKAMVKGKGVRSRRGDGPWTSLAAGDHELAPGTELRLARSDRVQVTQGDRQANLRGAGEFVIGSGDALVEARTGDLTLQTDTQDLQVAVPGGFIVVRGGQGGSEAVVRIGEDDAKLALKQGTASVDILGTQRELTAGQEHNWENPESEGAQKPIVAEASYFNVGIKVGESFVVHAPEVPASVRFDFAGKCPGEGVIELNGPKTRTKGKGGANVVVPAVSTPYNLRCVDESGLLGKPVARGTIQMLNDAGTRRLPSKAPTSFVEADGRTYTIYYQNQLPEISVRWPNAPAGKNYDLMLDGQPVRLDKAEHLFRSGTVRDGTHQLSFQAGDRRSRTTTVEVRFDNAAPKASLTSPIDRGFKPGDTVTIEGVALETWKVSVEGGSIQMDGDDRFVGQVASAANRPDIAVRLAHPRLGVHYYLRRAAGSP